MAMDSLLKIVSEKWVKPSSPTPESRKCYKLSSLDHDMPDSLISVALFYSHNSSEMAAADKKVELLETSLSKTLTYYYPFAGRLNEDKMFIDCNDAGVHFLEVQFQASLSEILDHNHHRNGLDMVLPLDHYKSGSSHLMLQLNHFQCGGVAIGACMSHRIGDGKTLCNFVRDWSEISRGVLLPSSPSFSGASIFPPSPNPRNINNPPPGKSVARRRFVFSGSNIAQLKKMVVGNNNGNDKSFYCSKVEVVTAVIIKSAAAAERARTGSSYKPCLISQAGNIRTMTLPPLSENEVGNFVNIYLITTDEKGEHYELGWLVEELKKSKVEFVGRHRKSCEEGIKNGSGHEALQVQVLKDWENLFTKGRSGRFDVYVFTSLCRFPYYQIDFGWGKPKFARVTSQVMKNMIIMTDTPSGDGVEALVALEQEQMSIFERDQELLTFAVLDPTISLD